VCVDGQSELTKGHRLAVTVSMGKVN
jgi:hypothetical protein